MKISFNTKKLQKACNSEKAMNAQWGATQAKKMQQRLMELQAADSLADISRVPPPRCHEMKGKYDGCLTVDLDQPYRLLFAPDHDPVPAKPDGGLDWSAVTEIVIIGVIDPH